MVEDKQNTQQHFIQNVGKKESRLKEFRKKIRRCDSSRYIYSITAIFFINCFIRYTFPSISFQTLFSLLINNNDNPFGLLSPMRVMFISAVSMILKCVHCDFEAKNNGQQMEIEHNEQYKKQISKSETFLAEKKDINP